ncbi:hypothetical protein GCM10029992_38200 [Glycomyces albus]
MREYQFDDAMVPALAKLVDAGCDRVQDMYVVSMKLQHLAPGVRSPMDSATMQEVVDTFKYHLEYVQDKPKRFSAALRPIDGDTILPRSLRQAGPEVQQLWIALEGQVTHPIAKARLSDIVYSLRLVSDRRAVAARTIRAYLETVGGSLHDRYQALNLVRAWSIAREMTLSELEEEAAESMLGLAEATIDSDGNPYAALPILTALTLRRPKGITPWLGRAGALLDRALTAYMNPDVVADFAELVRQRAGGDQARIERASRRQVGAILTAADAAQDGLLIRHYLDKVAKTGRRLGIVDLAEQAESRLPHLPPVDWTREGMMIVVPESLSGPFIELCEAADTWQELLKRWFDTPVPSGPHESNSKIARHTAAISPMRSVVTHEVYRAGDLPARTESGEAAVVAQDLVRAEITTAAWQGTLLARACTCSKDASASPARSSSRRSLSRPTNCTRRTRASSRSHSRCSGSASSRHVHTWRPRRSKLPPGPCCSMRTRRSTGPPSATPTDTSSGSARSSRCCATTDSTRTGNATCGPSCSPTA